MHNVFCSASCAEYRRVDPCSAVFSKKLYAYQVAVVCVSDEAALVFADNVVRKCYVVRKVVFIQSDYFLFGMPAS